jgi:Holliday junction resolvase
MARYRKGADSERELIKQCFERNYSVVRVAGSGKTSLPAPDVIALKKGKILAFECKAWDSNYLTLGKNQMSELVSWSERAGADMFIAWKIPKKGWIFLKPSDFKETSKNFIITRKKAFARGQKLSVVLGEQARLKG